MLFQLIVNIVLLCKHKPQTGSRLQDGLLFSKQEPNVIFTIRYSLSETSTADSESVDGVGRYADLERIHLLPSVYFVEWWSSDTLVCNGLCLRVKNRWPKAFNYFLIAKQPLITLLFIAGWTDWSGGCWNFGAFRRELCPWPLNNDFWDSEKKVSCIILIILFINAARLMFLLFIVVCCVSVSPGDVSVMWRVHTVPPSRRHYLCNLGIKKQQQKHCNFTTLPVQELPCVKSQISSKVTMVFCLCIKAIVLPP